MATTIPEVTMPRDHADIIEMPDTALIKQHDGIEFLSDDEAKEYLALGGDNSGNYRARELRDLIYERRSHDRYVKSGQYAKDLAAENAFAKEQAKELKRHMRCEGSEPSIVYDRSRGEWRGVGSV